MDVHKSFLHGNFKEEVYIKLPLGFLFTNWQVHQFVKVVF